MDVSFDIAQTMLFFCRGQPFFGILNIMGLVIQASILIVQMARGTAESDSFAAVVLQSDAITHYMSSWDADMAITGFYGKTYREAFGETYLSLTIALSAVFTVRMKYWSDVCLFIISVLLSVSSVKSGVADALEFFRAEEESIKAKLEYTQALYRLEHIEAKQIKQEVRIRRIPANDYYMRTSYGGQRFVHIVGLVRMSEALTCPIAMLVLACSS